MGSLVANSWTLATIRIKNDWEECGTGLLISQTYEELAPELNDGAAVDRRKRTFLVTNKHVLGSDEEQRKAATKITIYPHISFPDGKVRMPEEWPVQLVREDGSRIWKGHPYHWIDVLAFDLTHVVEGLAKDSLSLAHAVIPYSLVAGGEALLRHDVTIGDEVLVIGFPDLVPRVSYRSGQFA